jgi:hypothetical protein
MKIIQIVMKKDEIYGLCDEGQLWKLSFDEEDDVGMWLLVRISIFGRMMDSSFLHYKENNLELHYK